MNSDAYLYWVALNMLGVSFRQFDLLLRHFHGNLSRLSSLSAQDLLGIPLISQQLREKLEKADHYAKEAQEEIDLIRKEGIRLIRYIDPDYPHLLKEISDPPPLLYMKGNFPKSKYYLAVVGTRRATPYGLEVAEHLCRNLSDYDTTIVSGLALGIDRKAHEAAIASGGKTMAVIGNGLSYIYPPSHKRLYEEISLSGAVLSEFPMKTKPERFHFPKRNRIISGLCHGVIVIEAPKKSGALITAYQALQQGREVFAVPGRITSHTSSGTNDLIQKGAKLVTQVSDILEEIEPSFSKDDLTLKPQFVQSLSVPEEEQKILLLLNDSLQFDQLVEETRFNSGHLSELLLSLEFKGLVFRDSHDHYYRKYLT
jgi:DNA processing protein